MKRVKLTVAMLSILLAVSVVLNLYQATYNPGIPTQKGEVYVVYGKVINCYTKQPVEKAEVWLIRAGGIGVDGDETDSDGRFTLLAVGEEMYAVHVRSPVNEQGYFLYEDAWRVADFKSGLHSTGIDLGEIKLIPLIGLLETEW